jgi:hypothetical protein
MKNFTLLIVLIISSFLTARGQTLLYSENFETNTLPDSVTFTGTGVNGKSSTLYSQGLRSDSMKIAVSGDSVVMTSQAFSTTGNSFLMLYFDHICKIEFFDEGYIEVSNDNGATWMRLTGTQYLGTSQFATQGNKFTAAAYSTDWAAGTFAVPTNVWWKSETFDISLLVGNAANVKIRFVLRDAQPGNTMPDNYAWFIDNIRVVGAFSELNPPVITMIAPIPQDTILTSTPYVIKATVTDASGLQKVYLPYTLSTGLIDTIQMTLTANPNEYEGSIPFPGYGRTILYKVVAVDNSAAHNIATDPASGNRMIYSKYVPVSTSTVGTGTSSSSTVGPVYMSSATSTYLYSNHITLCTPAEAGFTGNLHAISWYKTDAQGYNLNNATYRIYLKHTSATSVNSAIGTFTTEVAGATLVYENTTQNLPLAAGWVDFILTNPYAFSYNGVDNLMVLVDWYRPGSPTGAVPWQYTTATGMACTWSSATNPPNITYGSGSRPNIKFTYVTSSNLTLDAGVSQIVNPTGGVIANTSFPVIARVKNIGTTTLTSAIVKWSLNGVQQTPYSWNGSLAQNAVSADINLGSLTLPLGVYTIKVWSESPNSGQDMNLGNDSSIISFMACSSLLSGTFTIGGSSPDFASFNAAIIAMNQCGINGPVTFNVAPGAYTEQVTVPFISGASATNPVVFQSANGDSTSVVLQYNALSASANYTLKFENAQNITFKKMTIKALNTTNGRVAEIGGTSSSLNIENCILQGVVNTLKSTEGTRAVVYSGNSSNSGCSIMNNLIMDGEHGLYLLGNSAAKETGTKILNNSLSGQIISGITLTGNSAPRVEGNQIGVMGQVDNFTGILLSGCDSTISVQKNSVVVQNAVSAHGIELSGCASTLAAQGLVANNMISVKITIGAANSMYPAGLLNSSSSHQRYVFNSVNVWGTSTIANASFRFSNSTTNNGIILLSNNFVNHVTGGTVLNFEGVTTSAFSSNYNNLYAADGVTAFLTSGYGTLAAWKAFSSGDQNSFSVKPYFNSNTNLHTFNGIINGSATPLAYVTEDIDGQPRNATHPDPGADEFDPPSLDVALLEIVNPAGGCRMDTAEAVTLRIRNTGSTNITTGLAASFRFDNSSTVVTENISTPLNAGDTLIYTFNAKVNMKIYAPLVADTFALEAWTTLTGDPVPYNDSVKVNLPSFYTPAPPTASGTTIIYGATATLTATSNDTIFWYAQDTSSVPLKKGATYTTPPLFGNTTYWVVSSTGAMQSSGPYTPGPNIAPLSTVSASNCSTGPCSAFNDLNLGVCGTQLVWISTSTPPDLTPHVNWIDFEWTSAKTIDGMKIHHAQTTARFLTGATLYKWDNGAWVSFYTFSNLPMVCENVVPFPLVTTTKLRITSFQMTGTGQLSNPNFREIEVFETTATGCESVRIPVTVTVGPPPAVDAGIAAVVNPTGSLPSGQPSPITVKLKNYGSDTLLQAKIFWSLNNVLQDSVQWTGILLKDSMESLNIDTTIFLGGTYCIKAWTDMPNGVVDLVPANDTATSCFNACMGGTYSIGPSSTGTYQFNSFNSAVNALVSAGICGHVVFDVYPGTYTEQVTIPQVAGVDVNNTVTFRGTGDSTQAILQFTASSTANWTLRLNGTDYFRFEKLTIKALDATNGRAVEMINGALYNRFVCNQILSAGTSSSTSALVYDYNTLNHYNVYLNNYMKGGYYGLYIYGVSTTNWEKGTIIQGNVIRGTYYYPIYVYYGDSVQVIGNLVDSVSSGSYNYGINVYYTNNYYRIIGNTVRIIGTSGVSYGIRDYYCNYYSYNANPSGYGLVANNMVSISGSTSGHYGMYAAYSNGTEYYYNSISISGGSSSYYSLYQVNTASNTVGQKFINNIFSNTGGGYSAYFSTPASVVTCDYNNYYATGASLAYWGAACTTLASLQTTSGTNAHSLNLNPPFTAVHDLHLNTTALSGKGIPVPNVNTDIDGNPRSVLPTIGADEIPLSPKDAGVTAITAPGTTTNEGQSYPVTVTVANLGTDTIFTMDVQYQINSGTPVTAVFTDTLLTGASKSFTLPAMISPAGNYTICAKTLLLNDSNTFNDQACKTVFGNPLNDAKMIGIVGLNNGCNVGLDTISIWVKNIGVNAINSPAPSTVTVSYRIKPTAPVVTQNFTPVLLPGDSVLFHFNTLADFSVTLLDDTFRVKAWIDLTGDNVKTNDSANAQVISNHVPASPVVSNVTIPYGTSTTLTAQSPDSILWFDTQTALTPLGGGPNYTTPVLYNPTTYWVQAGTNSFTGGLSAFTSLAAGNSFDGNMFDITPTTQIVLDSFDVNVATGADVVELYYRLGTFVGHNNDSTGWIKVGSCTINGLGSGQATRALVGGLALQPNITYGIYITVVTGTMYYTNTTQGTLQTFPDFTCMWGQGGGYPFALANPGRMWNGRIYYSKGTAGCASTRVPLAVTVSNQQACDLGVTQIIQPASLVNLTAQEPVMVRIQNYGSASQTNFPVSFQVNNQPVITETVSSTLLTNTYLDYTFNAKANLATPGTTYTLKAYTGISCDPTPQNDTLTKSVTNLLPNYCVSSATSALNEEVTNVSLNTLNNTSAASGAMYTNFISTVPATMLSPGINYPFSITSSFAPGSTTSQSCWVKAWIDYNRDGTFDPVNEEVFSSVTTSSNTVTGTITIPTGALLGTTYMRVVLNQVTSASLVLPCSTYTYGETEDYALIIAPQVPCDAGLAAILQPTGMTQAGTSLPVWVKFTNFGSNAIVPNTLSIAYKVNNGTPVVTQVPTGLASGATDSIQLPSFVATMGYNTICAYTMLACDTSTINDQICKSVYAQYYTSVPYFDDFEGPNNFYKPDNATLWQLGTPNANIINSAFSGTKAWVTNLTGDYFNNADEYLYTPVFNFSGLGTSDTITLSFNHWLSMAASDYGQVQYNLNAGAGWANLGFFGDANGTNWYNTQVSGVHYFSQTNSGWMYSAYKLPPATFNGVDTVQFRFRFYSNASGTSNGWAVDNFKLALPLVPNDIGVYAINYPVNDTAAGSQINAVVTVKNFGTNPQVMFPIDLKLNGVTISTETWTGTLNSQGTTVYSFVMPFTSPSSTYQLCVTTQLAGDAFAMNDQMCKSFNALPAYYNAGILQIVNPLPDSIGEICFWEANTHPWYKKDVFVRIQNFGQNTLTNIPVKYTFYNGGQLMTDIWTGSLAPGNTIDYQLSNLFPPKIGAQQLCAETNLMGDNIATNNKACQSYIGRTCIGIGEESGDEFVLQQCIPNPASGTTSIPFHLPVGGEIAFGLLSMYGQQLHAEIRTVQAGNNEIEMDVSTLASGIYYYYLEYNGQRITRKMIVN